jgi:hypothetical protein
MAVYTFETPSGEVVKSASDDIHEVAAKVRQHAAKAKKSCPRWAQRPDELKRGATLESAPADELAESFFAEPAPAK